MHPQYALSTVCAFYAFMLRLNGHINLQPLAGALSVTAEKTERIYRQGEYHRIHFVRCIAHREGVGHEQVAINTCKRSVAFCELGIDFAV